MTATSQGSKKALLFYWATGHGPQTVSEQLASIVSIPGFAFDLINLNYDSPGLRQPLRKIKALLNKKTLKNYDAILFHSTASYNLDHLVKSFQLFSEDMAYSRAKKILFKQDEMIDVNKTKAFVKDYNVDVLFTCIPAAEIRKVYPSEDFPRLKINHMLTGYLTDELIYRKNKPLEQRTIDISYRGMKPPFEWGRLSYEKYQIAEEFLAKAREAQLSLRLDISANDSDRIGKTDWYDFLENSKACLATESGASIFDFDGSIKKATQQYLKKHPQAAFEDVEKNILSKHENNIRYNQVSPRHLEAAAMETALIMFEGEYSGIFKPHENFIPLKKDFSNFKDVIDTLKDEKYLKNQTSINKRLVTDTKQLQAHYFIAEITSYLRETL